MPSNPFAAAFGLTDEETMRLIIMPTIATIGGCAAVALLAVSVSEYITDVNLEALNVHVLNYRVMIIQ